MTYQYQIFIGGSIMMTRKLKYIVISFWVIASLMLTIALVHTFAQVETGKFPLGCIMETPEMLESIPKAEPLEGRAALPSVVDLSDKMPAPGNQGSQNSCTAWAVAYAYKSFQEKIEHNWDLNNSNHIFSPAYVYNQINGGVDRGSYISKAMNLIVNQGVCSLQDMPYTAGDYWSQPTNYQKQRAAKYKALNYMYIEAGDVATMKAHLAAGDALTAGIPVYPDFDNLSASNPIYDNASGTLEGYHAICFVGYDDSKRAFKFINSWGTGYGQGGYGYMSYDLVTRFQINSFLMTDIIDSNNVLSGVYTITNKCSGKVLDIRAASTVDSAKLQQWNGDNVANQKFRVEMQEDGYYKITAQHSGKVLDVPYSTSDVGVQLQQWEDNGTDAQRWQIVDDGNGYYKIISKASGLLIDVLNASTGDGAVVQQFTDNGNDAQRWSFTLDSGVYTITNKCSGKVLDIRAASTEDSAKLQQWTGVNVANQKFKVEMQEDGYYKITAQHSGKVLDVPYNTSNVGAQLQQWEDNGTDAQRWQIIDDGNGYYKIISKTSGLLMDVLNASTVDGAVVQQFTDNGNDAQRWSLTLDSN
jgi:C1A family cysteine protease